MFLSYNDRYHLHPTDTIKGRAYDTSEVPARAEVILRALSAADLGPLTVEQDFGLGPLLAVHDPVYVSFLQTAHAQYARLRGESVPLFPEMFPTRHLFRTPGNRAIGVAGYYALDGDTPILPRTWDAAYGSAQCALTAARAILAGERAAYALCRPPGHHAPDDRYGGFCYLNNAAIAARYLQTEASVLSFPPRVAILDIDFHHGNGTQAIFYADPSVLFCSLHIDPDLDYPYYSGGQEECGAEAGAGLTRNWPLPFETDLSGYLTALDAALQAIADYDPRYLIVSAGFDIVRQDPLGAFRIDIGDLHTLGRRIASLSLPTLIVQEGGYRRETLGEQVVTFLRAFVE